MLGCGLLCTSSQIDLLPRFVHREERELHAVDGAGRVQHLSLATGAAPSRQTDLRVLSDLEGSQRRTVNRASSDGCTHACDVDECWMCASCLEMGDLREGTTSRVPDFDLP